MTREEIELRKAITELQIYHFPGSETELVTLNGVRRALNLVYRGSRDKDSEAIIMYKDVLEDVIKICNALIDTSWESCLCGHNEEVLLAKSFVLAYERYLKRIGATHGNNIITKG